MSDSETELDDVRIERMAQRVGHFVKEFSKESDRAAVIVGAAKLDLLLYQALQSSLQVVPGVRDDLLDAENAVGTFSARIHLCFRLGLIDAEMSRALHLVRRIRNDCAHEVSSVSLSGGPYADRIRELIAPILGDKIFENLRGLAEFGEVSETSRHFRGALAMMCVALEYLVEHTAIVVVSASAGLRQPK
jgi:hypothetical protein